MRVTASYSIGEFFQADSTSRASHLLSRQAYSHLMVPPTYEGETLPRIVIFTKTTPPKTAELFGGVSDDQTWVARQQAAFAQLRGNQIAHNQKVLSQAPRP